MLLPQVLAASSLPGPQERLELIEKEKYEELERMRKEGHARREQAEQLEFDAEQRRDMPIDDSKIVEQMFGFLPEGEQAQFGDAEGESNMVHHNPSSYRVLQPVCTEPHTGNSAALI